MLRKYRAVWIDAQGQELRTLLFEYDPTTHEGYEYTARDKRDLYLATDGDGIPLEDVQSHIERGYLEVAYRDGPPRQAVFVHENGYAKGYTPNPHPALNGPLWQVRGYYPLVGPAVLVQFAEDPL